MKLSEKIILKTSLPMQACIGKLSAFIDASGIGSDRSKTIEGHFTKERFCIAKKIEPRGRNSLRLWINGKFIPLPTETQIVCDCGMSPIVLISLGILFVFPLAVALPTATLIVVGKIVFQPAMIGSVIFLLFYYGFLIVVLSITSEMRMADQKYLIAQIMDAVHAETNAVSDGMHKS